MNDKVLLYSVTTRYKDFNPKIDLGLISVDGKIFKLSLGKTKFSEISYAPSEIMLSSGARRFFYWERYYLGNPGKYQTYILSFNDAGYGIVGDFSDLEVNLEKHFNKGAMSEKFKKFRNETTINTYSITSTFSTIEEEVANFGPDLDQVRLFNNWRFPSD